MTSQNSYYIHLHNNYSDTQLWDGIQSGDTQLFKALYGRYVLQLSNQAYKLLQDEELTRDLVQDVFLNLYIKRNELPADLNAGAYLTTIVKNKSLNMLRDIKLKQHHYQLVKEIIQDKETTSQFELAELRMQLNTSLGTLQGKCKDVFFLRHYENKSYKEISTQLGISARTVEKHISKAIQLLKEKMGREWGK